MSRTSEQQFSRLMLARLQAYLAETPQTRPAVVLETYRAAVKRLQRELEA